VKTGKMAGVVSQKLQQRLLIRTGGRSEKRTYTTPLNLVRSNLSPLGPTKVHQTDAESQRQALPSYQTRSGEKAARSAYWSFDLVDELGSSEAQSANLLANTE
jgi:hypothetical protein